MSKKVKEYIENHEDYRMFVVPVNIFYHDGLSQTEKLVYIALQSFCNAHGAEAWPSYQTIAEMCSMARRTAIRVIGNLIEKGLITKESRFIKSKEGDFKHTSNLYTIQKPIRKPKLTQSGDLRSPSIVIVDHHHSDRRSPDHLDLKDDDEKNIYKDTPNKNESENNNEKISKAFIQIAEENGLSEKQIKDLTEEVIEEVGRDKGIGVIHGAMKLTMRLYEKEPVCSLKALFKANLKKEKERRNTLDKKSKKEKEQEKERQKRIKEFTFYNWLKK